MAFGITPYELTKLVLMVATLAAVLVSTVWMNVRLGETALDKAEVAAMLADEAAARARWNEQLLSFTRGEQNSLKDRVENVEAKVVHPPKVVVVVATPRVAKSPKPTVVPTVVPTPKHIRGGLGALFGGGNDSD